jgi:ABC-type spermidine/putrescine transport system permease subunit I
MVLDLQAAATEYLGWLQLEANRSPNTVRAYDSELRKLIAFLASNGHTLVLNELSHEDLRAYQRHLAGRLKSPASRARALVAIRSWLKWLAKEGIVTWLAKGLHLSWLLDGILGLPVIGGPSLSFSYIGTFLVFVYIWIPYMILPIQAALERVPANYIEASADLGAEPRQTFWTVVFPLALPGIIAGSIFTFSLTLGDYIVPTIVGNSRLMIGQAVYTLQGTAGNVPLAAAFTVVPMVIMGVYLYVAKRMGAFNVL